MLQRAGGGGRGSLPVVASDVTQATSDKQKVEPMFGNVYDLPDEFGEVADVPADNGYFSETNVNACATAGIAPLIATGRDDHHPSLEDCPAPAPPGPKDPTRLRQCVISYTSAGKKRYALRKQVVEPIFGITKSVSGFRQYLLRGLDQVCGEWSRVTISWNIKRMFVLAEAN